MNLVLCMAGLYKRFRDANYSTPKFLLPWEEDTILSCIIKNMLADGAFSSLLLTVNKRDESHANTLERILNQYCSIPFSIQYIEDTQGQAETAFISCQTLKENKVQDKRVIFHNIDTILLGRSYVQYRLLLQEFDGLIDVFLANSKAYSYVAIDEKRCVERIAEKVVISPFATTGLYGFRSFDDYIKYYHLAHYTNEYYISNIYDYMLQQGEHIIVPDTSSTQQTIVLGTPDEYEQEKSKRVERLTNHEYI